MSRAEGEAMPQEPVFDVRKSVPARNTERVVILSVMSVGLIVLGLKLIPDNFSWEFSFDALEVLNGWAIFGLFLAATGLVNLIKVAIFAFRARGTAGQWRFCLTKDTLIWQVPDHAHGPETGFETPLSNIRELEVITLSSHDDFDETQYWIHFNDRDSVQLHEYTGVSMSWLVSKIHEAGVPFRETLIER